MITSQTARVSALGAPLTILILFLLLSVAYRLPFMSNILVGEEGTHAYLVMGPQPVIKGDDGLLVARLDGEDLVLFIERSVLIYQFLDVVGRGIEHLLPACRELSFACVSFHARFPFLVIFMGGVLVVLFGARRYLALDRPRVFAVQMLVLLYLVSTPLMVGGAVQPQIDGALGVLIVATAAGLLLALRGQTQTMRIFVLAFAGGLAGALGKNEWAIALAGAAVITALLAAGLTALTRPRQRDWGAVKRAGLISAAIVLGIVACQFLLYVYSPRTYLGGLDVMFRIAGMKLSIADQIARAWDLAHPVILACGLSLILIAMRLRDYCLRQPSLVIIAGWASIILIGYVYSGWSGDGFPRYYCPPAMLAATTLVCLISELRMPRPAWAAASIAFVLGIAANSLSLSESYSRGLAITSGRGSSLNAIAARYTALASRYDGTPIYEGSAIGIYFPKVDWVAHDLGLEGARSLLRKRRPNRAPELVVP